LLHRLADPSSATYVFVGRPLTVGRDRYRGIFVKDSLLSRRVYDVIYNAMLTDRLGPGDRLNRRQVAEDLGVSVAPVLEAMTQLEWEGFLATTPRRGTIVSTVTANQVLGRFRLRIAIETQAARIYAGSRIRAQAARIRELAAELDATRRGTLQSVQGELRFHHSLVDCAGCPVLSDAFGQVMRHSLYYAAKKKLPHEPKRPEQMHVKLAEKLLKAGPDQADLLIRSHLEPWITLLAKAAAEEPSDHRRLDARGEVTRLTTRKKLRPGR
jgi:DNA-binding GntR family transcriptional regulator